MQHERGILTRRALFQRTGCVLTAPVTGDHEESTMQEPLRIPAEYYQHMDANYDLPVPEEGFGGWKKETLEFSRTHTAVVVMHAWDHGTYEEFPGWWRVVPYIPRSKAILRDVFPPLLKAVRASDLPLFHVAAGGDYYKDLPGHKHAIEVAASSLSEYEKAQEDPIRERLYAFRQEHAYPGLHNLKDIERGFARVDFPDEARPEAGEGIAENGQQLFGLCKEKGINHLIYCGFAINWCLLLSPGGMAEMQKYGVMCSAIRQATTAVESKESAPRELCKEFGLWRVSLSFGFVFDVDDFVAALEGQA